MDIPQPSFINVFSFVIGWLLGGHIYRFIKKKAKNRVLIMCCKNCCKCKCQTGGGYQPKPVERPSKVEGPPLRQFPPKKP